MPITYKTLASYQLPLPPSYNQRLMSIIWGVEDREFKEQLLKSIYAIDTEWYEESQSKNFFQAADVIRHFCERHAITLV
jgi:hypothetical protein